MSKRSEARPSRLASARELFGLDVRSLILFRIALASLLLVDLGSRLRYLDVIATDAGIVPVRLVRFPSLHALSGSLGYEVALVLLAALFAVLLLVGYATRLAALASWILFWSLLYRNTYLTDGGDVFAGRLLLWCVFLPLDARASLAARRGRLTPGGIALSAATLGLIFEFVYLYVSAGLVKASPEWRSTFTALEQVLGQGYWLNPAGEWLRGYPALLRMLTPLLPLFEIVAPLLLFVPYWNGPVRCAVIVAFWLFQLGLGACIQLNLFPWFTSAATLALLPGWLWDRLGIGNGAAAIVREPKWSQVTAVIPLLCFAFGATPLVHQLSDPFARAFRLVGLGHRWSMYAIAPKQDFRFEARGTLASGSSVSLLDAPAEGRWAHVRDAHATYRVKYFLPKAMGSPDALSAYLGWLCREWNAENPAQRLANAQLFVDVWRIQPPRDERRHSIATIACAPP